MVVGSEKELANVMKKGRTRLDIINYALTEAPEILLPTLKSLVKRIEFGTRIVDERTNNIVNFLPEK